MVQKCDLCSKQAGRGNSLVQRGKAKYLGGNGRKTTGITKRYYYPNLQTVHVERDNGGAMTIRACTKCIRSGAVRKRIKRQPFTINPENN